MGVLRLIGIIIVFIAYLISVFYWLLFGTDWVELVYYTVFAIMFSIGISYITSKSAWR